MKKHDAGANKAHKGASNASKLDQETEDFHHEQVSSELKKQIQQARTAKKLTQAQVRASRAVPHDAWSEFHASGVVDLAAKCFYLYRIRAACPDD